ncbi:GDP-mannose-dependent alpha-(1-6)-phosphatidylinositol monomannoside mannosyltransferase, partial [Mycobacterium marinum]
RSRAIRSCAPPAEPPAARWTNPWCRSPRSRRRTFRPPRCASPSSLASTRRCPR